MRFNHLSFLTTPALGLAALLAVPAAHALPFSVTVALGDGSVIPAGSATSASKIFDFEIESGLNRGLGGSGDVCLAGDGSVRIADVGACDGSVRVQSFDFSADVDTDPFIAYSLGVTVFGDQDIQFNFLFATPYTGGPYDRLDTELLAPLGANGGANEIAMESVVDGISRDLLGCTAFPCDEGSSGLGLSPVSLASSTMSVLVTLEVPSSIGGLDPVQTVSGIAQIYAGGRAVPEPGTFVLFAAGLLGGGWARRLRRAST